MCIWIKYTSGEQANSQCGGLYEKILTIVKQICFVLLSLSPPAFPFSTITFLYFINYKT